MHFLFMGETAVASPITRYAAHGCGSIPTNLPSDGTAMVVEEGMLAAQLYEICMRMGEGEVIDEAVYDQLQPILSESRESQEQLLDILWLLGTWLFVVG